MIDGFITDLAPDEIFVFGSNLAGRHGRGAALTAWLRFGARRGIGHGPTGRCYAIPTKDERLRVLSLLVIARFVADFLRYAASHPQTRFLVTALGTGLAGYPPASIGPLFHGAPPNVILPPEFSPQS